MRLVLLAGEGKPPVSCKTVYVSLATTYQWIRKTVETLGEPVVAEGIQEIEIDEMWHFLRSKKQKMDHHGAGS